MRTKVVIESPYAGEVETNLEYARLALKHSILVELEAPIASHLLYTQCLDDKISEERALGIECGFAWVTSAYRMAFYVDLGVSKGMEDAYMHARLAEINVELRSLRGSLAKMPGYDLKSTDHFIRLSRRVVTEAVGATVYDVSERLRERMINHLESVLKEDC
jgi:hypothetical protein